MNWRLRLALEEIAVNSFYDAYQIIEYISEHPQKAKEEMTDVLRKYSVKYEIGEKVTFHCNGTKSKGIVKAISDQKNVFVVYSCNGDWEHYYNYTGEKTDIGYLTKGWEEQVDLQVYKERFDYE